jgi:REP element-mobilizing transposase RayT
MINPDWKTLQVRRGRNLPHWNCTNGIYHVCFRLADSIPREKMVQLQKEKELLVNSSAYRNRSLTQEERKRLWYLNTKKIEHILDAGYGNCYLRRPEIAEIVKDSLHYFEGQRYYLHAWSIMPNHVHVIVEPVAGWKLAQITHSWKSFTANMINRKLSRHGQLWQYEPYDHLIRNESEYLEQMEYVWNNPEKAGLSNCLRWRRDR